MTAKEPTRASGKEFNRTSPPTLPADAVREARVEEGPNGEAKLRLDLDGREAACMVADFVPPEARSDEGVLFSVLGAFALDLTVDGEPLARWGERHE